jgi:hypothetical protein
VVSGKTWNISMTDSGKWSWSQHVTYSSSLSSAEWILEAPTLVAQTLLAPVETFHFGPTSTYTAGGVTHTIAQGDPTRINLSPGLINEAGAAGQRQGEGPSRRPWPRQRRRAFYPSVPVLFVSVLTGGNGDRASDTAVE